MSPIYVSSNRRSCTEVGCSCIVLRSGLCPYLWMKVHCSDSIRALLAFLSIVSSIFWLDVCSSMGSRVYLNNKHHPFRMRCEPGEKDKENI